MLSKPPDGHRHHLPVSRQIVTVSVGFTLEWMNLNMLTRPADWRGAATVNGVNRFESGKFWHKNAD